MSTGPELLAERTRLLEAAAGQPFPRVDVPPVVEAPTPTVLDVARTMAAAQDARTLDVIRTLADLDTLTYALVNELEVLRFTGRVVEEDLTVVVDVYLEDLARATDALDLVVDRLTSALEAGRR